MTRERIPELDALRGVAAIAVVLFHVFAYQRGFEWTAFGVTGVSLFFLISGFVIFMSVQHIAATREFIVNRIARLYPVYWACVSITFIFYLIQQVKIFHLSFSFDLLGTYVVNMTMLQNYFDVKSIDGSYWTLLVELQFYAMIALLFHYKLLKHIDIIGLALLSGIIAFTIITPNDPVIYRNIGTYAPILNHFGLFFSGIIFYKIFFKMINTYKAVGIILICFAIQIFIFSRIGRDSYFISKYQYAGALSLYFVLFSLLSFQKLSFIRNQFFFFFGKISYPLYVIHQFLCTYFLMPLLHNRLHLPVWLAGSITVIIVIALATLITKYIEVPYRIRFKEYFIKTKKVAVEIKC